MAGPPGSMPAAGAQRNHVAEKAGREAVALIVVGERDRDDFGDITSLARSIEEVGLLHPVVVTPDRRLVAGGRRLAAVTQLGWREVPVTVVDLASAESVLRAEADENTCRKDLTPTEAAKARARRAALLAPAQPVGGRGKTSAKLAEVSPAARETRKVAAIGTGYSGSTLDKVDKVAELATDPAEPEVVREAAKAALTEIDQTGRVDGAYRSVVEIKNTETIRSLKDAIDERLPDAAAQRDLAAVRARIAKDVAKLADLNLVPPEVAAQAMHDDPALSAWRVTFREHAKWAAAFEAALTPGLRSVGGSS